MKLLPLAMIMTAAFFCSSVRDALRPAPSPPQAANKIPPDVTPSMAPPPPTLSNKSTESNKSTGQPNGRNKPRTISGGVLNGKAKTLPQPPYPPAARAVRAAGSVSVQVLVDENGRVVSATAVSGHPLLRAAAEQAARQAEFSPTLLGGESVKVSGVIVYNFVP